MLFAVSDSVHYVCVICPLVPDHHTLSVSAFVRLDTFQFCFSSVERYDIHFMSEFNPDVSSRWPTSISVFLLFLSFSMLF